MKDKHESMRALLAESINVLCKSGIQYTTKLTIQGLLGITIDDADIFLVDIHEKIGEINAPKPSVAKSGHTAIRSDSDAVCEVIGHAPDQFTRQTEPEFGIYPRLPTDHVSRSETIMSETKSHTDSLDGGDSFKSEQRETDSMNSVRENKQSMTETIPVEEDTTSELAKSYSHIDALWSQTFETTQSVNTVEKTTNVDRQLHHNSTTEHNIASTNTNTDAEDHDEVVIKQEKSDASFAACSKAGLPGARELDDLSLHHDCDAGEPLPHSASGSNANLIPSHFQPFLSLPFMDMDFTSGSTNQGTRDHSDLARAALQDGQVTNNPKKFDPSSMSRCGQTGNVRSQRKKSFKRKQHEHICEKCSKVFFDALTLKRHMMTHIDARPHVCKICGKSFKESFTLNRHSRVHSGHRPYVCSQCGRGFYHASDLKRHTMTQVHSQVKSHICNICGKTFIRPNYLRLHLQSHLNS